MAHKMQRMAVPQPLRPWVSSIHAAPMNAAADTTLVRPPAVDSALVWRAQASGEQDLVVTGPRVEATYLAGKELPLVVTFVLHVGVMESLLGVLPGEISGGGARLSDLDSPAAMRIAAQLAPVSVEPGRVAGAVADAVLGAQRAEPPAGGLVGAAASALSTSGGSAVRLGALARDLAISERQLRTRFTREVGIGPKSFTRILRLRSTLTEIGERPGAEIAVASGYSDQSHMAADFRRFMRVTPRSYAAGELPVPEFC